MECTVSADDLGLSRNISDGILAAFDGGYLNSCSIVANGEAFDYAIAEYKKRRGLALSVHLNLVEGRPLCWSGDVDLLIDERGEFCRSFASLLAASFHSSALYRRRLRKQIFREASAQISRVGRALGMERGFRIDGHRHYQMIPIVFDALMEVHEHFPFSYVRTLHEPFFLVGKAGVSPANHLGPNMAKHLLLKALSRRPMRLLDETGIAHCDRFVGLLFSGNMSEKVVASALAKLERSGFADAKVELLLHPGAAAEDERTIWQHRPALARYYFSEGRLRERATLSSNTFRDLFRDRAPHLDTATQEGAKDAQSENEEPA